MQPHAIQAPIERVDFEEEPAHSRPPTYAPAPTYQQGQGPLTLAPCPSYPVVAHKDTAEHYEHYGYHVQPQATPLSKVAQPHAPFTSWPPLLVVSTLVLL